MSDINLNLNELDEQLLVELNGYINELNDPSESLINVLHKAQHLFGYIPHNLQLYIARAIDVSAARVNGVVSFYSYFSEKPFGKHTISICMGTACYVKGAEKILHKFLDKLEVEKNSITTDECFSVRDVRCIGACGLAPVVTVGEKVFGHVTEDKVLDIIEKYQVEEGDLDGN